MAESTRRTASESQDITISDEEIRNRKAFLQFAGEDEEAVKGINELAKRYADAVIEDFYRHLLSFAETRAFFTDPKLLARVKNAQRDYFLRLTAGDYDRAYVANRLKIGAIHEHIGLPVKAYLGMYSFYLRAVAAKLMEAFPKEPAKAMGAFTSLMKLTFLDMGLAIETYVDSRERTIRLQQQAILELSTPVLPLRPGLLILPIVGQIDSYRARQLTEQLLRAVRSNRSKVVVIDITGVPSVDSRVANHLVQTVEAARLMGTISIISGVAPEIAQTMVTLGIDLGRIRTVGDLQSGIEVAEHLLGYKVVKTGDHIEPGERS